MIAGASDHPGSVGGFSGQLTLFDAMSRAIKISNPTETSASGSPLQWVAAGDDAAAGWLYTQQTYDWKGRPLITTNADGTTKEASYGGCGCAGGQVVTLRDEAARQQRAYSDVLSRTAKTEVLNWDGSIYSTTTNTYNARDQVTLVRKYQGTDISGFYQDTTMSYDGYGRLQSKHVPEQNASTATTYSYNSDDTVSTVTDARGATQTLSYNNRHLVTSTIYSAPGGIAPTASANFAYDATGNSTSMTDGMGSIIFNYDQLSRLTSETRYISDLAGTTTGGIYTLNYGYNLAGQVTSVSDPNDLSRNVAYIYDSTGRITDINGNGYGGVTNFANVIQYRAWGATKHVAYGNGLNADLRYNQRLQTSRFELKLNATGARYVGVDYQYTTTSTSTDNDGRLKFAHDLDDSKLDRRDLYDSVGRISSAYAGSYLPDSNVTSGPYQETFGYDVWGNLTDRTWRQYQTIWTPAGTIRYPATLYYSEPYANNRSTNPGWSYDADGRILTSRSAVDSNYTQTNSYDAAGQMLTTSVPNKNYSFAYDGSGERVKFVENGEVTYYVISSVLGGQATIELNQLGQKKRSYVYGAGQVIAKQEGNQVLWDNRDPSGRSTRMVNSSATVTSRVELDPLGVEVDPTNVPEGNSAYTINPTGFYGTPQEPNMGCSADGVPAPCDWVQRAINGGAAVQCRQNNCGWRGIRNENGQAVGLARIRAYADGTQFFLPAGVNYVGNNTFTSGGLWFSFTNDQAMTNYRRGLGSLQGPTISQRPVIDSMRFLRLEHSFSDARSTLTTKGRDAKTKALVKKCLDFFTQGGSLDEVLNILDNFRATASYDPSLGQATARTANSGGKMAASVRLGDPFFADDNIGIKGTGLNWNPLYKLYTTMQNLTPRQNRSLSILHEFAHALGLIPHDNPSVDPTGKISAQNDATIFEKCGDVIDGIVPWRD